MKTVAKRIWGTAFGQADAPAAWHQHHPYEQWHDEEGLCEIDRTLNQNKFWPEFDEFWPEFKK